MKTPEVGMYGLEIKLDSPCPSCRKVALTITRARGAKKDGVVDIPVLTCRRCGSITYGDYVTEDGVDFAIFDPPLST